MIKAGSLSSSSKGNAFFINTGDALFIVDAGISCKKIINGLKEAGQNPDELSGIFITHEHTDHIAGLRVLLKNTTASVYINRKTYEKTGLSIPEDRLKIINADDIISFNNTKVESLSKFHDSADPCLFTFCKSGKKISFITDAGHICENIVKAVADADVVFLESNYDDNMLINGDYPVALKKRIKGKYGHLSNSQAALLIAEFASEKLKQVFLSHISENNNTPGEALRTFRSFTGNEDKLRQMKVSVAYSDRISDIVELEV